MGSGLRRKGFIERVCYNPPITSSAPADLALRDSNPQARRTARPLAVLAKQGALIDAFAPRLLDFQVQTESGC